MSLLEDFVSRIAKGVSAFIGDQDLMNAAVSAAAQVMTSDDEVAHEELETALVDLKADEAISKGYLNSTIEGELSAGIDRACSTEGRKENLRLLSAIKDRPVQERNSVFLIALDVAAAHGGISSVEGTVLNAIADVLAVDKMGLIEIAKTRALVSGLVDPERLA